MGGNYWAGSGLLARKMADVGRKNMKCSDKSETSVIVPILWFRAFLYDPTQPGQDKRWDHFDVLKYK